MITIIKRHITFIIVESVKNNFKFQG